MPRTLATTERDGLRRADVDDLGWTHRIVVLEGDCREQVERGQPPGNPARLGRAGVVDDVDADERRRADRARNSDGGRDVVDHRLRQEGGRTAADSVGEQRAHCWEDDETADLGLERLEAPCPICTTSPTSSDRSSRRRGAEGDLTATARQLTVEERELDARHVVETDDRRRSGRRRSRCRSRSRTPSTRRQPGRRPKSGWLARGRDRRTRSQ